MTVLKKVVPGWQSLFTPKNPPRRHSHGARVKGPGQNRLGGGGNKKGKEVKKVLSTLFGAAAIASVMDSLITLVGVSLGWDSEGNPVVAAVMRALTPVGGLAVMTALELGMMAFLFPVMMPDRTVLALAYAVYAAVHTAAVAAWVWVRV